MFSANNRNRPGIRAQGKARLAIAFALAVVCGLGGFAVGKLLGIRAVESKPSAKEVASKDAGASRSVPGMPKPTVEIAAPHKTPLPVEEKQPLTSPQPVPVATASSRPLQETIITYGKSVQGRPLTAYILGDGPDVTLFFGAFHGNEPITDDVVLKLRTFLKANPGHLQGRRVVLAPVVNPDGLRRNRRVNANGVDINRNFPGTWRKKATKERYNPGPSPASEPESKAVIKLMDQYRPTKVVSIHQPFHTMNYTGQAGNELALAMRKHNRYPVTGDIGYPTPGSFGDYCGKTRGIAIVTHELPTQSADAAWRANREAWLAAIKH